VSERSAATEEGPMIKELKKAWYKRQPKTDSDPPTGAVAFRALAILRGLGNQGDGQLSLLESCDLALKQGAAYKKCCEQERPIRSIGVWVQGQPITVINLGQDPVVENFTFNVASSSEAVMEILNVGEGEENIVILRLRLALIPRTGIDQTTKLPNGQRLRLKVRMTKAGRFQTLVEFSPERDRVEAKSAVAKRKRREEVDHRHEESKPVWWGFPVLAWQLRSFQFQLAIACALMLIMAVFFWLYTVQMRDPKNHASLLYTEHREPIRNEPERNVTPAVRSHEPRNRTLTSRKKPAARRVEVTPIVYAILLPYSGTRETPDGNQQPTAPVVVMSGTDVNAELKLPDFSVAGVYRVVLLGPGDRTLYRTQARSSDGKTMRLVLRAKVFSLGRHELQVVSEDETYFYYLEVKQKAKRG
jgi:hypothetical protein